MKAVSTAGQPTRLRERPRARCPGWEERNALTAGTEPVSGLFAWHATAVMGTGGERWTTLAPAPPVGSSEIRARTPSNPASEAQKGVSR